MSFNLPDTIVLPASPERINIAIAELVIFATVLPVQLGVRYVQIRRHVEARIAKNPLRCFLRGWWNFVIVFAQIRIVGFALYLGLKNPSKGVVIAEVVLQSVGLSPLLLELSFTLLRWYTATLPSFQRLFHLVAIVANTARNDSGHAGSSDKRTTKYPKFLERLLQYTRVPVVIAVILIIIAGSILNMSFLKAGAVLLLATYIYIACIAIFLAYRYRECLVKSAQFGLWIAIASLPLYAVRVIYLMLVEFGDVKFDPVVGGWRYLTSLGFAMEVGIVVFLVMAGIAIEPLRDGLESDRILPIAKPINCVGVGNEGMFSDR